MKKILYSLFALMAMCTFVTSCGDDDIDWNRGTHANRPETTAVGTYSGTWEVFGEDGVTSEGTFNGSVSIAAGSSAYTVNVTTVCSEVTAASGETAANIAWSNDDLKVFSTVKNGTLETMINAEIVSGNLNLKFSKTVREGRKTMTKFYQFKGRK
jgi:hypothetical protein